MSRQIFRPQAVARYNARLDQTILPRLATMPWSLIWWLFAGLLLGVALLIWAAHTPVYLTGPAVMIPAPTSWPPQETIAVAVFLPADGVPSAAPGQRARLEFAALTDQMEREGASHRVVEVTAALLSPQAARARYALDSSTGLLIEGPVMVALIALESEETTWLGSVGEAHIEVGTQSGLALLPGVSALLHNDATN